MFQDEFRITSLNPDGKKFEKVDRIMASGIHYDGQLLMDVNSELLECAVDDRLSVCLLWLLSQKSQVSLAKANGKNHDELEASFDKYQYVMYGTVYKYKHTKDDKVEVHLSHGGLLARVNGDEQHLHQLEVDSEIYTMVKKFDRSAAR